MRAEKTQALLDWLPVRVFTFIFALGGHFTQIFACWRKNAKRGVGANDALLEECGIAALDVTENGNMPEDGTAEDEAIALLDRVFVMAVVLLAAAVLLI